MWGTWCGRSFFSHSQTLLSLRPLFFGGCPELFDGLGATDASKSGSSWSSRSCLPYNSTPTSSSLVSSASLMTMFLCPAGNQVSSKSLSSDVPEMFDLSFCSTSAETICMSSRFCYFSTLNVLKIIKNKFSIFWHNKRLVAKSTQQNLMRQTAGRSFDTRHFYHKIPYLQEVGNIFTCNCSMWTMLLALHTSLSKNCFFSYSYVSRKIKWHIFLCDVIFGHSVGC